MRLLAFVSEALEKWGQGSLTPIPRASSPCTFGREVIGYWYQSNGRTDGTTTNCQIRVLAAMELHSEAQEIRELIFEQALSTGLRWKNGDMVACYNFATISLSARLQACPCRHLKYESVVLAYHFKIERSITAGFLLAQ